MLSAGHTSIASSSSRDIGGGAINERMGPIGETVLNGVLAHLGSCEGDYSGKRSKCQRMRYASREMHARDALVQGSRS